MGTGLIATAKVAAALRGVVAAEPPVWNNSATLRPAFTVTAVVRAAATATATVK